MRPRKREESHSDDLFRARLDQIINMKQAVVRLAEEIDWDWIDDQMSDLFSAEGRPGTETRFMIGILLLKQIYGLSDEGVWERWVHDPYFQHFTGETFFQHGIAHERSGLSHWRGRLGEEGGAPRDVDLRLDAQPDGADRLFDPAVVLRQLDARGEPANAIERARSAACTQSSISFGFIE